MSAAQGVLVIGYGNPLRGDDGAGWRAAELLALDPRLQGATVLARHQLTPELAEDVSQATLLVLVDASEEPGTAGRVSTARVTATPTSGPVFTHHVDAAGLVQLAATLFGQSPPAVQVTVRVADVQPGTTLSPQVEGAMANVVDAVVDVIQEQQKHNA
ncbi:MAG: hydrogenase maturation protease [Acidimicrobiales bacterium]